MITPEIKDEILGQFISSGMRFTINLKMHCHNFNITFDEFDAILRQFEKTSICLKPKDAWVELPILLSMQRLTISSTEAVLPSRKKS